MAQRKSIQIYMYILHTQTLHNRQGHRFVSNPLIALLTFRCRLHTSTYYDPARCPNSTWRDEHRVWPSIENIISPATHGRAIERLMAFGRFSCENCSDLIANIQNTKRRFVVFPAGCRVLNKV